MAATLQLYTEEQLLQMIIADEVNGLELLFKNYYKQLWRFAKEILKNTDAAEDAVQDVFIKFWEKRNQINITTSLKAYLFTAVRNTCFNQLKASERNVWLDDTSIQYDMKNSSPDAISNIAGKELEQKIATAIEALPPRCGLVFKLSRFENKSYKEIAEIMDISVKTVDNQMGKALMLMRQQLAPYLNMICLLVSVLFFS
jgi:RNA polymerase sigma-70 factor (family 1)